MTVSTVSIMSTLLMRVVAVSRLLSITSAWIFVCLTSIWDWGELRRSELSESGRLLVLLHSVWLRSITHLLTGSSFTVVS